MWMCSMDRCDQSVTEASQQDFSLRHIPYHTTVLYVCSSSSHKRLVGQWRVQSPTVSPLGAKQHLFPTLFPVLEPVHPLLFPSAAH